MSLTLYVAFVISTLALLLIPGPNVALIVATAVSRGPRAGFATVAGTSAAMIPQLGLTGIGIGALFVEAARAFALLRWLGVGYLLWLAYCAFSAPADALQAEAPRKSARALFLRGFFVSLSNPKTLLFFGAFFPQFIDPRESVAGQIVLLSITFVALAALVDSGWVLTAARVGRALRIDGRIRNRLAGSLFLGAGLGLALIRKP